MGRRGAVSQEIMDDIREELFNDYLKATPSDSDSTIDFHNCVINLEYLKNRKVDNDTLAKFKDIVINKYNVYAYDNFIRYLKTDQYIDKSLDICRDEVI
jgi:hypothetical protein